MKHLPLIGVHLTLPKARNFRENFYFKTEHFWNIFHSCGGSYSVKKKMHFSSFLHPFIATFERVLFKKYLRVISKKVDRKEFKRSYAVNFRFEKNLKRPHF